MTFRRTWEGVEWRAPMSDCSREAWNAPKGIDGAVHWQGGTESELHYARFVNGEERKAEYIELDGVKHVPERTCKDISIDDSQFYCGECECTVELPLLWRELNYCPDCGAKVVS